MHTTIWFNALALRPGGSGVQTYIRELLSALSSDTSLVMSAAVQVDALGQLPQRVTPDARPVCAGVRRALQGLRTPAPADLVHGLDVDLPLRARGAGTVATVHDAAVVDVPWAFPASRARAETMLLLRSARTADMLVVPSDFTADRIQSLFGRRPHVIPLAAASWATPPTIEDIARVRTLYGLPNRFVLQVGSTEPRKLSALLIAAARQTSIPVVLAGLGSERLTGRGVLGLGHVPVADLPSLYAAANIVSYLSAYEGFGLPPLEAAACGAAVMASAIEPITAVLGDGASLVVNREDTVATALAELMSDADMRHDLRERGRRRAAQFSWEDTARATAEVYRMLS
ncbi:MAG: glycosyltransferase family 1 protein [Candidatus Nanopelagicales bacterium]